MTHRRLNRSLAMSILSGVLALWLCLDAHAGNLKIAMADGTSLQVPFCWEEAGQIKFEIAGGVVGIPKGNVTSIQEIITAGELDPATLRQGAAPPQDVGKNRMLQSLASAQAGSRAGYRALTPEEAERLMELKEKQGTGRDAKNIRLIASVYREQADFSDLVQLQGNGLYMVVKHILSTQEKLRQPRFSLHLYDGEGILLQRKPCDIQELSVDKKTLRQLGISGTLFSVAAMIKPDPRIKRYEITASQE